MRSFEIIKRPFFVLYLKYFNVDKVVIFVVNQMFIVYLYVWSETFLK